MGWFRRRRGNDQEPARPAEQAASQAVHTVSPAASASSDGVAPDYWLTVANGIDAIEAIIRSENIVDTFFDFPILLLPEFPLAIEAAGRVTGDAATQSAYSALAASLRERQALLRQAPRSYATLASICGRALATDPKGDARINLRYAVDRFAEAAANFGDVEDGADAMVDEARTHKLLAEMGVAERFHVEAIPPLVRRALQIYGSGPKAEDCIQREAWAQERLAGLSGDFAESAGDATPDAYWLSLVRQSGALDAFIKAQRQAAVTEVLRSHPTVMLPEIPLALQAEADAATEPQQAEQLRAQGLTLARTQLGYEDNPNAYGIIMIHCANGLAYGKQGDPRRNLARALDIYAQIRSMQPEGKVAARSLISEAIARRMLAEEGADPHQNLDEGLRLCRAAAAIYVEGPDFDLCRQTENRILELLAPYPTPG